MVHDLRGSTHSRFFAEALFSHGGAPANVSVDGADAWNGVRLQVAALHGDPDYVTPLEIDGEVNILEIPTQTILFRALTGALHMGAHFYSQHWRVCLISLISKSLA